MYGGVFIHYGKKNGAGGKRIPYAPRNEDTMGKKPATVFVCQECGYESPKWMGQCICGAWNSMVEEKVLPASAEDKRRRRRRAGRPRLQIVDVISGSESRIIRKSVN